MSQTLKINVALQIQKPPKEVFDAIVDPDKMKNYFISESSGKMEAGKIVTWKFPEFELTFPVRVDKAEPDNYISYYWDSFGQEMLVEISLAPGENNSTVVTITEGSRENDEAGIQWLQSNTEGWANFLACLKAYLDFGINLRKGGFDFRRQAF